jgi:ankyrin repeat protein
MRGPGAAFHEGGIVHVSSCDHLCVQWLRRCIVTRFMVEPLPARPSLEMQRKLAKRLLRDAWSGDAEAIARVQAFHPGSADPDALKLHDAQLVIARGYGFESWAAMTRKIESLTMTPIERFDAAVRAGDAERAHELLPGHADVRARIDEPRFDFDSPAIHQGKKNLPLVDVLLRHGADINARSAWWAGGFGILESGLTLDEARPLIERGARVTVWAAAGLGLLDELKELLRAGPDLVSARGGDGKTPLHCAANCEIARLLLDSGAELETRDVDHASTPLQYLINDAAIARLLIDRGAGVDIFAAVALDDRGPIEHCLRADPKCADARIGRPPFTAPGGHIYGWTLGFDLTPIDLARQRANDEAVTLLLSRASPKVRYLDACWSADGERARAELAAHPRLMSELDEEDRRVINHAAWWYRPAAVRLMLELGFDLHVRGAHQSTVLDRACFHGYADIVEALLAHDRNPPLTVENEFGGTPVGTCIYGSMNGWDTGHPRDHERTLALLLEAGARPDPTIIPTGNDAIDGVLRDWFRSRRGLAETK